jgi:hypothetical protein
MTTALDRIAPAFVAMAHSIVWAGAATVDAEGRPWSRVLHPLWTWDGEQLTGIVATSPLSPKAAHIAAHPHISFTYWRPSQDTCSAACDVAWDDSVEGRTAGWEALAHGPEPVGYDPAIVPGWDEPTSPAFGILRLRPWRLHVMPGTVMLGQGGDVLTWQRA